MNPASLLVLALLAQDPEARVTVTRPSPGVVRLGESSVMKIAFQGARTDARVELPEVDGLRMVLGAPSRESRQFIVNGRFSSTSTVTYQVRITPQREGVFTIPSFVVTADGEAQRTPELKIEAVRDLRGAEHAFLEVVSSARRVYVHEPLTLSFDYGVNNGLSFIRKVYQRRVEYADIDIEAGWLDDLDGLVPIETEADYPATEVVALNGRPIEVDFSHTYEREGRTYHRFRFDRTFLPNRSGTLQLDAPMLRFAVSKGRPRRGFFGEVIEHNAENYFAYGEPLEIEVLPIPDAGRPTPYYGAVGRFAVAASLDRNRVKVGNSVKLMLSIEGRGNLEFLRVPELEDIDGFHVLGQKRDEYDDRIVATYDLTPLHDEVRAVPSVAWNYFDTTPGVEKFVTVATDPLPLEVVPLAEGETLAVLPGEERAAVTPGVDDIFDMKPLEATDPAPRQQTTGRGLAAGLVVLPWLLCGLLLLLLGRAAAKRADVVGQRARGAEKRFRKAVADGATPGDALVGYLADRLGVADAAVIGPDLAQRLAAAGVDAELAGEVQRSIEAAVASRYGGGETLGADAAAALVRRLEGETVQASVGGVVGVLLAAALLAGAASAQGTDLATAEAAYRNGEYERAAEAFAAAAEREPDGRVLYNLGNCRYRLGEMGEALVAYERARLALPRDPELLANIALVRAKLELGSAEGEPFLDAVAALRARFTPGELLLLCVLCNVVAAACLVLGWRRGWARILGALALVHALLLAAEVLWFGPTRPPLGIVTARQADLVSEPRDGLDAVLVLREGVDVEVLSAGPAWTRVRVQGRAGYVAAGDVGVVE